MFTAISLYSGADNLGDGLIQAGGKIKLAIERDSDCCETIKLNHPDTEVINGLVSDHLESLPRADCVIGGPPCPEFSRAKTNRTMDLCEVNNFLKAREITKCKYHFMENVQDLFKVHKEKNFLINCADYGVPQTRIRRIFTNLPLPKPTHAKIPSSTLFEEPMKKWVSIKDALGIDGIILDKTQQCWKQKIHLYKTDKPHPTILTDGSDNGLWFVSPTGFDGKNKKQSSCSIDEPIMTIVNGNDYIFTDKPVMSTKYHQFKNDYKEIRRLTNEELAILQGFRTDFKFYGKKTSTKRQIGNALPAAISKAFFEQILTPIRVLT